MDSLAGYIASLAVGVIVAYLSQFLKPKISIKYWQSHNFMYTIPRNVFNPAPALPPFLPVPPAASQGAPAAPPHFFLLTQSLTVQNFGRETAEWVEIVHKRKPDFFQLFPALNFTENISATGEHTLRVQSLARKEFFTIQFLCYTHMPELSFVRSPAGQAFAMPWMTVRRYPSWFYAMLWLLIIVGSAFCLFWIIKGGMFVFKGIR